MNKKNIDSIDIEKTAALASLALTEEEKAIFEKDMEQIVNFASTVSNLSASPKAKAPEGGEGREDLPRIFSNASSLLNEAPCLEESFIAVPKIID